MEEGSKITSDLEQYIGTKLIKAKPMTRGEYAKYSGRNSILTDKGESESDAGYFVVYNDGYQSWSPAEAFDVAYRKFDQLSFGHAIELMKKGFKLARAGWNGKQQYIQLATCISYKPVAGDVVNAEHKAIGNQAIAFVGTSGVQMGWLASQADMLATDWQVVKDN